MIEVAIGRSVGELLTDAIDDGVTWIVTAEGTLVIRNASSQNIAEYAQWISVRKINR